MSKIIRIFLNFFLIENYQFRSTFFVIENFLITSIFKTPLLLKWCPIFDSSPLTQFLKFNNFLWVCWFLGKNLPNFVPPAWKLDNLYYHSIHTTSTMYIGVMNQIMRPLRQLSKYLRGLYLLIHTNFYLFLASNQKTSVKDLSTQMK